MTQQSEAQRLADELDAYHMAPHHKEAAAELRRLDDVDKAYNLLLEKTYAERQPQDIIRMAREALVQSSGFTYGDLPDPGPAFVFYEKGLERFAALVAAAEREACAEIAETPVSGEQDDITMQAKDRVAAAIRARGQDAA